MGIAYTRFLKFVQLGLTHQIQFWALILEDVSFQHLGFIEVIPSCPHSKGGEARFNFCAEKLYKNSI